MIVIRPFNEKDYPAVINLWKCCNLAIKQSDKISEIKKVLKYNPDIFLVALEKTKLVACVLGTWDGRRGWVNHLAVDPEKQKLGIGKKLINELELRLKQKGCLKINLTILPDNDDAVGFYKKTGYQIEKVIFMSKKVDS